MKAKISLCIPSLNNEKTIARCITSVRDMVDQIVVLDSGSADCTLDVVKKFDGEINREAWKDHAADYYNKLFSFAKYDYILFMRGDEYLCDSSRDPLRALLQIGHLQQKSAVFLKRKDVDRFKSGVYMGRELTLGRIFHRHAGFWKFPAHAYFYHAGDPIYSNVLLFRDRLDAAPSDREARQRHTEILKAFLAARPDLADDEACRLYMLKASDHLSLGAFDAAAEDFDRAIHFGNKTNRIKTRLWYVRSFLGRGLAHYMMEDFDGAARIFFMTDDVPETIVEKYFLLGRIACSGKRWSEAFNYYRIALNNRGHADRCFFCIPFRIVFHLLSDAREAAATLGYKEKEKELTAQIEASFGHLLPMKDEVTLFP
jgi:glycosyltransferase involved in cell wall biosynthesis